MGRERQEKMQLLTRSMSVLLQLDAECGTHNPFYGSTILLNDIMERFGVANNEPVLRVLF